MLRTTIELVNGQHLTAMLATHSPTVATSIGCRQIVLAEGRVVFGLAADQRINDPAKLREFLDKAGTPRE